MLLKKNLNNVEMFEFKKLPKLESLNSERPQAILELFGTIESKITALLAGQEFEQKGFSVDNFKIQATLLVNMSEAIGLLSKTPEKVKERLSEAPAFMQRSIAELQKQMENEESEIQKDLSYTLALMNSLRYVNKNAIETVKELSSECYYALKSLNDLYTVNMQIFCGKVERLVAEMNKKAKKENERVINGQESNNRFDELVRENKQPISIANPAFEATDKIYQEFKSNQENLFRDHSAPRFKVFASSKKVLATTMKSQKSFDKLSSTRSLSPILEKRPNSDALIPLKDLKEIIEDIQNSKRRYDTLCDKKQLRYESLKTFVNIYLKEQHTTSKAIKEFLEKFNKSLSSYYKQDTRVKIFRAVYENVIDEEFFIIADDIRDKLTLHLEVI